MNGIKYLLFLVLYRTSVASCTATTTVGSNLSLLILSLLQVYSAGYLHKGSTVGEALRCCGAHASLPTEYFYHYTGKSSVFCVHIFVCCYPRYCEIKTNKKQTNKNKHNKQARASPGCKISPSPRTKRSGSGHSI